MKKKATLIAFIWFAYFGLIAAIVPEGFLVPVFVITLVTSALIPVLGEAIKWLVAKAPKLAVLRSKGAISIYCYAIAIVLASIYSYQAGLLPAMKMTCDATQYCYLDWNGAFGQVISWGSIIAAPATILYNVFWAPLLDHLAAPDNVLAYKLQ
jgi:hypothetical protein